MLSQERRRSVGLLPQLKGPRTPASFDLARAAVPRLLVVLALDAPPFNDSARLGGSSCGGEVEAETCEVLPQAIGVVLAAALFEALGKEHAAGC